MKTPRFARKDSIMAEIDRLDRGSAIELLKKMRSRSRNLKLDKDRVAKRLMASGISAGSAFGMGYLMGDLQKGWEEKGSPKDEDPRVIAGIDMDLLVGLVFTLAGVSGVAGKQTSDLIESAGIGVLAGWAYKSGEDMGLEPAKD